MGGRLAAHSGLHTAGINTLALDLTTSEDGTVQTCDILQSASTSDDRLRTHRITVSVYDLTPTGLTARPQIGVTVVGGRTPVPELIGRPAPDLVVLDSVRPVTVDGTAMYEAFARDNPVPPLVLDAVALARQFDFTYTVHPATGRLLAALAGGIGAGVIGETGTGTGAGVAWMLSTASPATRIVSIELDPDRVKAAAELFHHDPRVTILQGDANELAEHGPFDLLVLDAPSTPGPLEWSTLDPTVQLRPHGLLVKDNLWPMTSWPPKTFDGSDDVQRTQWLEHPDLFATEVTVADGYAVLIARRP